MINQITYFTHNKFAPHRSIEHHTIKFSELTFLISGEMVYYVDNVKYAISSGDIIYVPSGSLRRRETGECLNDYVSINFHSESRLDVDIVQRKSINDEVKYLLNYFEAAYYASSKDRNNKLKLALETLVLQLKDNEFDSYQSSLSSEIISYIHRHYAHRITLDDISKATFYSAAYCENEFKKTTGKSIINYLIDIRIGEAKKLLEETSMSCADIAAAVGFEDANYFSRVFKKRTGYSPLRYRDYVN
ncbi:MAG: helix-turn-helix transcriptional regulator [Clostridia bacterium]|nr:helix-turn-helix transcriptional regulator [Clostridia bacterium]